MCHETKFFHFSLFHISTFILKPARLISLNYSISKNFGIYANCIYVLVFFYSRSAVLRGRVVTETGRGLVGVRVTHADLHTEGYTMTQEDGWFDFMVNGGGAITLKFGKSPFPAQVRTLFAPWNEVRIYVLLTSNNDPLIEICLIFNHTGMIN